MSNGHSGQPRSRWWEDYLVRYVTGTLVGTFCVFILLTQVFFEGETGLLAKRIFFSSDKDSTWLGLIVMILAGGAYCYLASVPITVFHAGRMIRQGMNLYARKAWYAWWLVSVVVIIVATFVFIGTSPRRDSLATWVLVLCALPVAWLFVGQLDVIWRLKREQGKPDAQFISFYRNLVRARERTASSGVRESYTHMREHANSVFIVVIELSMLATLLLVWRGIGDLGLFAVWCLGFLLLWTSPNVLIWGLANSLEKDLADHPSSYTS